MSDHNPETGEVIESTAVAVAADGNIVPGPARTAGSFLDMIEDGDFSLEVREQLRDLAKHMEMISNTTQAKCKGKLTLTINLEKDGEAFRIQGDVKVKKPELPRRRSIAWTDESGDFTRFPPNQTQMFGAPRTLRTV